MKYFYKESYQKEVKKDDDSWKEVTEEQVKYLLSKIGNGRSNFEKIVNSGGEVVRLLFSHFFKIS